MDTTFSQSVEMNIEGAVYETALSLNGREREIFLERAFRGDARGLERIKRLLERSGESAAFFLEVGGHGDALAKEILEADSPESAADTEAPLLEGPGSRIGPYRLIERIGEGGCGVVYEAEQEKPVRRHVALKIIRLGMDTESVIARFEAERQALALMDHPNIARVFDAGATAAGRPYFVMERVNGERITLCCDRERLDIVARIHLFIQVCSAIQHAHQKGVIHRDIKPSNILVAIQDGVPAPKVIDFGIAKATDPSGTTDRTLWTMRDQLMGTPPYMSPEQVDMGGIDIDTRSDIYSLGALLHELLGGRPPFDKQALAKQGISEMRRTLLEIEPPLPSRMLAALPSDERAVIAAARREEPTRLISRMRGDLDWIVAKAMSKNRDDRYQTVNALAVDLRRFLANEPVAASKPSRIYLLGKFIRRNRVACLSGAAVVLSLVIGLGAATSMYLNESRALAEQERLSREAEAGRAREAWLHAQAQARANVSQAAVLLAEERNEEADALLLESPLESIEPSREAANVFRAIGSWNSRRGRWRQAVQCFTLLNQANRLDDPVRTVEGSDLLAIAPVLLLHGGPGAYERFRSETMDSFLPAQNALQAEHLLKTCLLAPADEATLERLKHAADICARPEPPNRGLPDWNALSMTIYHHRLGDPERTLEWAEKCLSFPDRGGSRTAAVLALSAMARLRTGQREEAMRNIDEVGRMVAERTPYDPGVPSAEQGSWFAWLTARILLNEAEGIAAPSSAQAPRSH